LIKRSEKAEIMARRQGAPVCGQFGQGKVAKSRGNANLLIEIEAENFPPVFLGVALGFRGNRGTFPSRGLPCVN